MMLELYEWGAATQKPICLYSTENICLTAPAASVERSEYTRTFPA